MVNDKTQNKPSKQQLAFLDWEMGAFFHFGIRTFYEGHRDWDGKVMPLEGFNPTGLDCENWIKTICEAGLKYAILVCKHHDGFANWPSKYSQYHVGLTLWKDGKGDVVSEFTSACRKYGIKAGLYYSPAEIGYEGRSAKEHDDYFIAQIGELLGNYGTIDYLWFDGNGSDGHEFDKERIVKAIRGLQPNILIFNMWDPDILWVGNEGGAAGIANTSNSAEYGRFMPTECDFMMRYRNWFYSEYDVHSVKSVEELVGLYYYSVGCGSNFLVNIGPDRRGLLPEADALRLAEFGREIARRFANPIPSTIINTDNGLTVQLDKERFVNHAVLSEDLHNGESVQEFRILIKNGIIHNPICVYTGKTIGHKRIITFPCIKTTELTVEITKSLGGFALAKAEAHYI